MTMQCHICDTDLEKPKKVVSYGLLLIIRVEKLMIEYKEGR